MADDLVALQRQIDGYSSSDEETTSAAPAKEADDGCQSEQTDAQDGEAAPATKSDDESFFDLAAVVAEGRQRRLERKKRARQPESGSNNGVSPGVQLPCPVTEIDLMAERVREETERREAHEKRAMQRPEELTHVSAGGPAGDGLSRRERRRQKIENANKKPQQVYVGLPIGKTWHVPLVGIEGRGGYRKGADAVAQDEEDNEAKSGEKRKAMTVKEKEKLKRKKGQSSHATWKPELWMQLRQQYD
ncbi:hypothetical protein BESB_017770 [Besnoitia besnoiti]|uniref:Uncharacterized protein n=1 Tax=Besnoitia besnoiti TaxID=94643 RepID=A0A2A9M3E2_BESBE|nr:hypothetical protein BESB_017770 [Besnoitia besnoiti]PFH32459.1 hypothetical protein BESB_017770 [Besnoitia besnoiti]